MSLQPERKGRYSLPLFQSGAGPGVFLCQDADFGGREAIERNIGARGLRAVMEGMLTQIMYDIPSDPTIAKAVITSPPQAVQRRDNRKAAYQLRDDAVLQNVVGLDLVEDFAENCGGDRGQRPAPGRPEASPSGIHPDESAA